MRPDRLCLQDIAEACDAVERFLAGRSKASFLGDELLRSAVLHQLAIVGEATARVSDGLRVARPELPWTAVIGFRNVLVHAYFTLDLDIIWETATRDLPELRAKVAAILADLPPEQATD